MNLRIPLKQAAIGAAAMAGVLSQGGIARAVDCDTLPSPIYVKGSSAVKPFLGGIGQALSNASPAQTVVYVAGGSCTGVGAVVDGTLITEDGTYWDSAGTETTCTMPTAGVTADLGVSDVFASSCADYTTYDKATLYSEKGLGDTQGPVQIMTFVAPKASSHNSISAEAAYLTFHFGAAGDTPWNDESLLFIRNSGSGTQSMLAKAINVAPDTWIGVDEGGSGGVVTAIAAATDADHSIGILSTGEADDHRDTMKILAYQHYGQTCGYLPDSSPTSFDKMNVRIGRYPVWGGLHMIAKVGSDKATPSNEQVGHLIHYIVGDETLPGATTDNGVIDVEIDHHLVPQCAMQVARDSELGPLMSISPTKACGCYFDSKVGTAPASCTSCTSDSDCSGSTPHCNYGFCEAT